MENKDIYKLVVIFYFSAAHKLDGYNGKCANLHGHNYKLELEVTGQQVNNIGLVVDSEKIKRQAKQIIAELDHKYLNELPMFAGVETSAENIAKYLYQQCSQGLNDEVATVSAVTLWENENFYVRYEQESN